jgi:hypothetical protein
MARILLQQSFASANMTRPEFQLREYRERTQPEDEEADRLRRALRAWCATSDDTTTEDLPKDNIYDTNRIG